MDKRDLHTPFGEIKRIDEDVEKGKLGDLLVEVLQEMVAVQKEQKDTIRFLVLLDVLIVFLLAGLVWFE